MAEKPNFSDLLPTGRIIIILARYILGYNWLYPYLVRWIYQLFPYPGAAFYNTAFYVIFLAVTIYLAWPLLQKSWSRLKKDKLNSLVIIILAFVGMIYVSAYCSDLAEMLSGKVQSDNQDSIVQALQFSPWLMIFVTLVFSPLVEEIVFRAAIFRPIQARGHTGWAITISALLFGLLHVYEALFAGNFSDIYFILSYGAMGAFMCAVYYITDDFYAAVLLHLLNNGVAMFFLIQG